MGLPGRSVLTSLFAKQAVRQAATVAAALSVASILSACERPPASGPIRPIATFGEVGDSPGQFGYPRSIVAGPDSLFIVDRLARIQRLDPRTGESKGEFVMPQWQNGKPTGLSLFLPEGAPEDDALLLVADTHYHRVLAYRLSAFTLPPSKDPAHAEAFRFGSYGNGPGQFVYTTDVAALPTPDGKSIARLYVSEYGGNDRVSIFEPGGVNPDGSPAWRFISSFGSFGASADPDTIQFNRPQALALDLSRRELIVADSCNHRIGRFTLDGALISWISGPGVEPGKLMYPYGIALLGDGTALVSEFQNNRVQRLDLTTGESLGIFGQAGRGEGQLASPWSVALRESTAYVLDSGNSRVIAFDRPRARRASSAGAAVAGHTEPSQRSVPR